MLSATTRRALQQNLYYALGIVVMKGVSLFMLPFIAHRLAPDAFGQLEILTTLGALGGILIGFGLLNTLFRYAGSASSAQERKATVATLLSINLLIGALGLAGGLLLADKIAAWLPGQIDPYLVMLAVVIVALDACIGIPLGWLRMQERAALFFTLNSAKATLQALLVIGFLEAGRGLHGVMEAGLIASLLLAAILLVLQQRDTGFSLQRQRVPELLLYSVPLIGSGLLGFILTGLDRWILADAVGTATMALYAVAAKFAMIAALLLQPFLMWWSPRRFQVLQEANGTVQAARFAAAGCALSLLIAVAVGLSGPLLIRLLLPQSYWAAALYVPWLVLIVAIKDCAELLNLGCYIDKTTGRQLLINLAGSGVGLVAMLLLVPEFGIAGAIAALMAAQLVRLGLYYRVSQQRLFLPYPLASLLLLAGLTLGLLTLGSQVDALWDQLLLSVVAVTLMATTIGLLAHTAAASPAQPTELG